MNARKKLGIFIVFVMLTALAIVPLEAQIVTVNDLPGVASVSGSLVLIRPPVSVASGDFESDTQIITFIEKENYTLPRAVRVNTTATGTFNATSSLSASTVASGIKLHSYFIQLDRTLEPSQFVKLQGSITFDNDIIGLILLTPEIELSNIDLGANGVIYGESGHGLELGTGENDDSVTVSSNRRTLTVNLSNNIRQDQIRVLTRTDSTPTDGDNRAPVANNDTATTSTNTAVTINVLSNDTDPNNNLNRSSLRITDNVDHGSTSINTTTQIVTYTPTTGFRGTDTFTYEVCDSTTPTALCDTATVTITVSTSGGTVRSILPAASDCSKFAQATIDIVPGNRDNLIRLDDVHGRTPIAILSTEEFPAANCVDVNSISFGRTGDEQEPISCGAVNTNLDRWIDVVCDFDTSRLGFRLGDTEGTLKAETIKNNAMTLKDEVTVVAPRRFPVSMRGQDAGPAIKTLSIGKSMYFIAQGQAASLKVEVFNITGQRVYESKVSAGNALRWNLRGSDGSSLANGVYFYVVTVKDLDGNVSRHLVKMAIILR